MPRTEVRGGQVQDGSVQRVDLDISTAGQAVITKAIAGAGIKSTQTGVDFGTGDVTLSVNRFTSADQTITSAGLLTIAHGLAAVPQIITCFLICQVAEGGYSIGDILLYEGSADTKKGISVVANSTDLLVRFSDVAKSFTVINKTTGADFALTNSSWKLRLVAST